MHSQTSNTFIGTKQAQSTDRGFGEKISAPFIADGVTFQLLDPNRFFNKQTVVFQYNNREELSQEEEDRFYKKALKSDLL